VVQGLPVAHFKGFEERPYTRAAHGADWHSLVNLVLDIDFPLAYSAFHPGHDSFLSGFRLRLSEASVEHVQRLLARTTLNRLDGCPVPGEDIPIADPALVNLGRSCAMLEGHNKM